MFSHETSAELARILEGVLVSQTLPGSPAERAGVRPGDIILSVNGQRTRSLDDYLAALDAAPIEIVVDVFRSGDRLTLSWSLARDRSAGPASSDPRLRN